MSGSALVVPALLLFLEQYFVKCIWVGRATWITRTPFDVYTEACECKCVALTPKRGMIFSTIT